MSSIQLSTIQHDTSRSQTSTYQQGVPRSSLQPSNQLSTRRLLASATTAGSEAVNELGILLVGQIEPPAQNTSKPLHCVAHPDDADGNKEQKVSRMKAPKTEKEC
ncbi:hypothetical protein FOPE_01464 [Fonsecaea pedrosoi]|nr:hypothetical protein FOPE_01464 [Fonsecaea pedrosoi]